MRARAGVRVGEVALVVAVCLVAAIPAFAQNGLLVGVVTDEVGEPVKGATVRVTTRQDPTTHLTATTGENGRFLFLVRRSDQWDFMVEAPGFASMSGSSRVRLGLTGPNTVRATLERREIPGSVGVLAGVNPRSVRTQLAAAEALFAAGRYDEAIAAYQRIQAQTPALSAVGLQLGHVYLQKKDYDRAEVEFRAVLEGGAADAAACHDLGDVQAARGLSDEAIEWYEKAVAADPFWATPLMKLAVLALSHGDRGAAIGYLKRVIALNPDSAEAAKAVSLAGQLGGVN